MIGMDDQEFLESIDGSLLVTELYSEIIRQIPNLYEDNDLQKIIKKFADDHIDFLDAEMANQEMLLEQLDLKLLTHQRILEEFLAEYDVSFEEVLIKVLANIEENAQDI